MHSIPGTHSSPGTRRSAVAEPLQLHPVCHTPTPAAPGGNTSRRRRSHCQRPLVSLSVTVMPVACFPTAPWSVPNSTPFRSHSHMAQLALQDGSSALLPCTLHTKAVVSGLPASAPRATCRHPSTKIPSHLQCTPQCTWAALIKDALLSRRWAPSRASRHHRAWPP